jgi:hypothetical protein
MLYSLETIVEVARIRYPAGGVTGDKQRYRMFDHASTAEALCHAGRRQAGKRRALTAGALFGCGRSAFSNPSLKMSLF